MRTQRTDHHAALAAANNLSDLPHPSCDHLADSRHPCQAGGRHGVASRLDWTIDIEILLLAHHIRFYGDF